MGLWKPTRRMDCIGLGQDFFLIKFSMQEDHTKVLKEGPWFVEGHYLSIRSWEPNFRPSSANLSSVVVWICLLELPIEYYDHSVLKEIGEAIGPILRIGTHTAAESKGCFARLCVQVNLDKPIVETCYYMIKTSLAEDRNGEESKIQGTEECTVQDIEGEPWVLVTRKRQQFKRVLKDQARPSNLGSLAHNPIK
nr:hypothetical protein CFP56_24785 [Quercus suber]